MIQSRRGVDFVTSDHQSPPGCETGFPLDPLALYHVQSAAAGTDQNTVAPPPTGPKSPPYRLDMDKYDVSMQHPELEAAPFNLSDNAWLNQRQELESQSFSLNTWTAPTRRVELDSHPYDTNNLTSSERRPELESSPINERSELEGDQLWTKGWTETPELTELHSNESNQQQLLELTGSLPSYTETQQAWPPYKHSSADNGFRPVSSWAPTLTPAFITGSSIASSPPNYSSAAQHYGPSLQPLNSVPTRFTLARHDGFNSTLRINNTSTRQLTPFDQSSYQISRFFPTFPQMDHGQERAMTKVDCIEGQSSRNTVGWHNFPQPDPLADYGDVVAHNFPRCSDEALLRTMSTHNTVMSMPYISKEPIHALGSGDHLMANDAPGGPNQIIYPACPKSEGPLEENNHKQQICPSIFLDRIPNIIQWSAWSTQQPRTSSSYDAKWIARSSRFFIIEQCIEFQHCANSYRGISSDIIEAVVLSRYCEAPTLQGNGHESMPPMSD
ncbi:MAG: hypothetical protein L6R42_004248 [Xanthoria sp. 1 TBL-2021]|nr:MAG: hypothetical protein L6R42_004248 [Xanthoria sp. 1 TBL-2021]